MLDLGVTSLKSELKVKFFDVEFFQSSAENTDFVIF